jgi:hypothetical protein
MGLAVLIVLGLAAIGMSAPKHYRWNRRFETTTVRVLRIDLKARTLLVAEFGTNKLYLAKMPAGTTAKVILGVYSGLRGADFADIHRNEVIRIRYEPAANEHLARMEDGREVAVVTATN